MMRIVGSKYITSAVNPKSYPDTPWKDFAFVGRSNVGKYSMINTITNRKLLAKIANKPGKTRLINFFEIVYKTEKHSCNMISIEKSQESSSIVINENYKDTHDEATEETTGCFGLIDLPGYGYAKVSKTERDLWQKMINSFFQYRKQLAGAVVLVDIRHDPDPKDIMMIKMLVDLKVNYMIAATKCDKIPKNKIRGQLKKYVNELKDTTSKNSSSESEIGSFICEFSSLKKIGIDNILNWIEKSIFIDNNALSTVDGNGQYQTSGRIIIHDKELNNA